MGTNLFFTEDNTTVTGDPNYENVPEKLYQFYCKTNKVLKMNRIFIERKDEANKESGEENMNNEDTQTFKITKNYADALNQFLGPGESQPRALEEADKVFFHKYGVRKNTVTISKEGTVIVAEETPGPSIKSNAEHSLPEMDIDDADPLA